MSNGSSPTGEIVLTFRYTEKEYLAAVRMYFRRSLNPWRDLILAPIVFVGCIAWWMVSGYDLILVVLAVLSMLLFTIALYLVVVVPRLHWRKQPKLRQEYTLGFSEEGISFRTDHIDSRLGWEMYERVFENEQFFILVYGRDLFSVVPKRAFSGKDQEMAFRELAGRKIQGARS